MNDRIYSDCCDFCILFDDSKNEVKPCVEMTKRCKDDTCATCPPCKHFVAGLVFTDTLSCPDTSEEEGLTNGMVTAHGAL